VQRNKIKRRLRMLARMIILNLNNVGYYYVIIAHRNIAQADYQDLKEDLIICLEKFH
jgi:ribonuclease P protein component